MLIQLEQKQLIIDYKRNKDENKKLQANYDSLRDNYDVLLKEIDDLKNNKNSTQQITNDTNLNNADNTNYISKTSKKEEINIIKKEESPINKSLVIKKMEFKEEYTNDKQSVNNINNMIFDVNNNINNIINKINKNVNNNESNNNNKNIIGKKSSSTIAVTFLDNKNKKDKDKKKIDEEKKELRLSKGFQRFKKNQISESKSGYKLNKSSKVQDMAKDLENKIQKKHDNEHDDNNKKKVVYESVNTNDNNMINVLKNQKLTKSLKKKKASKTFNDNE